MFRWRVGMIVLALLVSLGGAAMALADTRAPSIDGEASLPSLPPSGPRMRDALNSAMEGYHREPVPGPTQGGGESPVQGAFPGWAERQAPLRSQARAPRQGGETPTSQLILTSVADACVLQGAPNANFGEATDMWVGRDASMDPAPEVARSLVRFDLSQLPAGSNISSATLQLFLVNSWDYEGAVRTITTYRVAAAWTETAVTWNNAPASAEAYGSQSVPRTDWRYYDFDVTELVRAWHEGAYPNDGIMVRGPESDYARRGFGARESASEGDYVPLLVIEYSSGVGLDDRVCGLPIMVNSFQRGLTYGSTFQAQNLQNASAAITITFYDQAGTAVAAANDTLPAASSKTYFAITMPGLPSGFAGSAVIASSGPIRAISSLAANSYAFGASSAGYNAGAGEVNLPLIMRNNSGFNTWFAVQNAGARAATVGVVFTAGSSGSNYTAPDVTIQPGASHFYYQSDMAGLGDKFVGSARAISRNGVPIVATVVEVGPTSLYAYDGFIASSPTFVAPLFQYYNAGFSSSIQIQNVGAASTVVTVQYTPSGSHGNACTETRTIPAGAAATYGLAAFALDSAESNCYARNPGTAFVGSATVSGNSASQSLVAIVNQHNFSAGKAAAYSALRPADGTQTVSVPLVMDRNSNYWTGITVYNAGSAATTVAIDYSASGADQYLSLAAGASAVVLNNGAIGDKYVGSAVVSGANASDKLLVIVNEQNLVATGDTFYVYNGFNQTSLTPPPPVQELSYDDGTADGYHVLRAAAVRFTVSARRQLKQLKYHLKGDPGPVEVVVYDDNWSVLYRASVTPGPLDSGAYRWWTHDLSGVAVGPGDFYVAMIWPSAGANPHLGEDITAPHAGRSHGSWTSPDPPLGLLDNPPLDLMIRAVVQ